MLVAGIRVYVTERGAPINDNLRASHTQRSGQEGLPDKGA